MNKFMLNITASSGEFYQGDCEDLVLPTGDGVYGVQAGHNPVLVAIHMGILHFEVNGEARDILVGDGIAEVTPAYVMVLVDSAERPEDIAKKGCPRDEQQSKQRKEQIERDFIQPALVDAVHALLVPHGAQQEDKQEQADCKKEYSQHDQQIARIDEPLHPRHNVQRGIARSKRAFEIRLIDHCDVAAVAQRSAHVLLVIGGSLAGIIVFIQCAGAEQNFTGVLVGELKIDVGGERVIAITEKIARDRIVLDPGVQRRPAVASRLL